MSTDRRILKNQASTESTRLILRSIVNNPQQYSDDEVLKQALKSQGGVAKLEYAALIDGKSVHKNSMSLNTLKTYANDLFDEGFEGLNQLRLKTVDILDEYIHRSIRPNSQSRAGLRSRIIKLEETLEKHRSVNFILLQAISSAMSTITSMKDAPDDSILEKRAKDGLARIRAVASLNPHPFDMAPSTIVSMKDYIGGM